MKRRSKSQNKTSQFSHYKRWTTDEKGLGRTFLALNEEDAKEYISKIMGDVKTLREIEE